MSFFSMVSSGIGGLGLFMLGMWLMSDGLKMAAGNTLNHFLHHWTNTRLRGLSVGFFLTSLIQSSSAVTVATIGFTNAGLLSLKRAIWIIFGSNIGTTTTAWLVTLIGFNFKISSFALPLIGVGMLLRLSKPGTKLGSFGQALVGFGILFLGIAVLKDTFSTLGEQISLVSNGDTGVIAILMFTGVGFLITLLMQSSSVTLALVLTALAGGFLPLLPATAIVIGSNLGTTSTAVLSSFGTNPDAKRVVASHVIFNVLTALVALLLLSPLLNLIVFSQNVLFLDYSSAMTLTLFHTVFNVIGVILMWPLAKPLVKWLSKRFKTKEEEQGKSKFLDKSVLSLPSLAIHALCRELENISTYTLKMAKDSLNFERENIHFSGNEQVLGKLTMAVDDFTAKLYQQNLSEDIAMKLPSVIRVSRYYDSVAELATMINDKKRKIPLDINEDIQTKISDYYKNSIHLLDQVEINEERATVKKMSVLGNELTQLEMQYQELKILLLRRASEGAIAITLMDNILSSNSQVRRMNQQAAKAYRYFYDLQLNVDLQNNKQEKDDDLAE